LIMDQYDRNSIIHSNSIMTDVIIASLPYVETKEPLMAPALLRGVVNKTGLTCSTIDLNIEILRYLDRYPEIDRDKVRNWFLYEENLDCQTTNNIIQELAQYACQRICSHNPIWICLSLFCNTSKRFNIVLCKLLRQKNPCAQIVIGGNAVFTDEKSQRPYGKLMKRGKLIDHFIVGDGEEPLLNLLTGRSHGVDIETFQILDDLAQQPYSDYSDYDWDLYTTKRIPMYASRGCVRRCTFCDVYKLWKKFKIRNSEIVFSEMLYQIEKTGISDFYFRDSLINGAISEYKKLLGLISEHNASNEKKITWMSFFIFRPQTQMDENDWALTAAGGGDELVIGVESLVDDIRYHMKKKFTNADILFGLQMAEKYHIKITMLLIVGYVNETEADFHSALKWLEDHKQYAKTCIKMISVGGTLTITDLSDLYQNAEDFDITLGPKIHLWENKKIGLDYHTREKRKELFLSRAKQLGYNIVGHEKPVS
jgi:hypothetical protein